MNVRSQLAALILKESDSAQPDNYRARIAPLEEQAEELESELSARSAGFRVQTRPVTLDSVQTLLPAESALIEFAVYTPRDLRTRARQAPRYLAYLLTPRGSPGWVDLGEASAIDLAVEGWRKVLRVPDQTEAARMARALDEKVMGPVRARLGSEQPRRLLIAPDGLLNLIPFAALIDEQNRYLVERYTISYLTSGRDLMRLSTSNPSANAPLVLANPRFGRMETAESGSAQIFFQALPGTGQEALAIKAILPQASVLLREQATEAALKQTPAPSLLHIATHGFFLDGPASPSAETRAASEFSRQRDTDSRLGEWAARLENPLLRSGLALAGANERGGGADDGVLTALEASSLNLSGTRLVVLSACDTGIGKVENGEGVYGLRRALVLAGSETQVMSLWPVSDRQTRELMVGYYRRLTKGEGRGEALRQIQLKMLKDPALRSPYYWASFIQAGEWANLEGRRTADLGK